MAAMDTQNRAMCVNAIPTLLPVMQDKVKWYLSYVYTVSGGGHLELNYDAFEPQLNALLYITFHISCLEFGFSMQHRTKEMLVSSVVEPLDLQLNALYPLTLVIFSHVIRHMLYIHYK